MASNDPFRWAALPLVARVVCPVGLVTLLLSSGLGFSFAAPFPPASPLLGATPPPTVDARVRPGSGQLPPGCDLPDVTATLTAFVDAFNRGDQAMLAQFFPAEAINGLPPMFPTPDPKTNEIPFMWYSVGGPRGGFNPGFTAHNRAELLAYFRERHAHHEQLRLLRLEVGTGGYPGVGFLYDLARQADDIPSHVAGGKGVMNCPTRTIFVWSMGERSVLPYFTTPNGTPGYG